MFHQLVGKASWLARASVTGNWPGFVLFCLRFVLSSLVSLGRSSRVPLSGPVTGATHSSSSGSPVKCLAIQSDGSRAS